jgi:MoaA/NifB/PqqE/SkfB family radical SAM enzyme
MEKYMSATKPAGSDKYPKTICMLPWMSIAANTTGTVRPCCVNESLIRRPDDTPYNLATDGIMEIYHSQWMKDFRQQFIDGKKPNSCRRCWNEEAVGKTSKRLNHMTVKQPMVVPLLNFNTLEPKHFLYLDLKLGSICNLKCRICGPAVSSKWAQESLMQLPYEERKTHQHKTWLVEGEWPRTSETFWQEVHTLMPKIKFLDFTGGEPFLIKEHFDLLKHSVDSGTSKYQHLFYNTNGTVFPEGAEELWKHFKRVEIAFSVDSLGRQFELERSGATWEEVDSNIQKFREMRDRLPHIELQVSATVSTLNVYYLESLCEWISRQEFNYEHFGLVHFPEYLSISVMPQYAKDAVTAKLQSGKFNDKHQPEINKIIHFMNNDMPSEGKQFRSKMKELDRIRNESFAETHPEMAEIIKYDAT